MKKGLIRIFKLILPAFLLVTVQSAMSQCATPTSAIVNNTNCTTPNGKITFTAPTVLNSEGLLLYKEKIIKQ
jgi:hypothetical protein